METQWTLVFLHVPFSSSCLSLPSISTLYNSVPILQSTIELRLQMGIVGKRVCFAILVLSLVVLTAASTRDPELRQCREQCRKQHHEARQKEQCEESCDRYYREKQEREQEREMRGGRGGGWEDEELSIDREDPQRKQLEECHSQCDRQQGQEKALCRLRCAQRYGRESEKRGEEEGNYKRYGEEEKSEERWDEGRNPYVFEDEHFTTKQRTEHGRIDILQRFTEKSNLLRGIDNYRFSVLEANPQTFVAPSHLDADAVLFVVNGRATITMIQGNKRGENKRESNNVECGDIVWKPAGTPMYLTNRDDKEKLVVVSLNRPVNTPGHLEAFFEVGGENPESVYKAFSREVLEAALNTKWNDIERLFSKQKRGAITKASREQIQGLSHHQEGGKIWPFEKESRRGSFNLFKQSPSSSNNYGQLWEATPQEFRQLQDIDLSVSFLNLTRGSMVAPYFNSRSTKIAFVVDGEGYFEMACPHVASDAGQSKSEQHRGGQQHGGRRSERAGQEEQTRYQKVSSRLRRGTVFVVPAGHPVTTVASSNNNLQIVCFEVNTEENNKFFLAGKNNIVSQIEREALELGFDTPASEVEKLFQRQNKEFFFPGPERKEEGGGRASA